MNDDKYLGHEICAVSGDWIIVWDGKYNYYLFPPFDSRIIACKQHGQMPYNSARGTKMCEFYTVYDTAVKNLCKVAANGGFFDFTRRG